MFSERLQCRSAYEILIGISDNTCYIQKETATILKWILKKKGVYVWTEFSGSGEETCLTMWINNKISDSIKEGKILAKWVTISLRYLRIYVCLIRPLEE